MPLAFAQDSQSESARTVQQQPQAQSSDEKRALDELREITGNSGVTASAANVNIMPQPSPNISSIVSLPSTAAAVPAVPVSSPTASAVSSSTPAAILSLCAVALAGFPDTTDDSAQHQRLQYIDLEFGFVGLRRTTTCFLTRC